MGGGFGFDPVDLKGRSPIAARLQKEVDPLDKQSGRDKSATDSAKI